MMKTFILFFGLVSVPVISNAQVKTVSDYVKWSMNNQLDNEMKDLEEAPTQETQCTYIGHLHSTTTHLYSLTIAAFFNNEVPKQVWTDMGSFLTTTSPLTKYCFQGSQEYANKDFLKAQLSLVRSSFKTALDSVNK